LTEFINELDGYYGAGITEEELAFTKSAIGQRDARAYETPRQKLGFLSRMMNYSLKPNHVDVQSEILSNITKGEIDCLATKYVDPSEMVMVVVGDKDAVYDDVKALGYKMIELDVDGNPVN